MNTDLERARRATLETWYDRSRLNGYRVEAADGWEYDGLDTFSRTLFVEHTILDEDSDTVAQRLVVVFRPKSDRIAYATLDGKPVDNI